MYADGQGISLNEVVVMNEVIGVFVREVVGVFVNDLIDVFEREVVSACAARDQLHGLDENANQNSHCTTNGLNPAEAPMLRTHRVRVPKILHQDARLS